MRGLNVFVSHVVEKRGLGMMDARWVFVPDGMTSFTCIHVDLDDTRLNFECHLKAKGLQLHRKLK